MKTKSLKFFCVALIASALPVLSVQAAPTELKYATIAPPDSPWSKLIDGMVANVAKNTQGEVTVKPYMAGQLGNEQVAIRQVASGRIDMGGFGITAVSSVVPELGLLMSPYLWDSDKQMECALDQHLIKSLKPYLEKRGLVPMGWGHSGYHVVFGKKAMASLADLNGVKIRAAPNKASPLALAVAGASPVILPTTEVASALQTGLVHAVDLPDIFGIVSGMGKLAPHMSLTNHIYQPTLAVVSKKSFDKLSQENQTALLSSDLPPAVQRGTVRKVGEALRKGFVEKGGQIHTPTAEQIAELKKLMSGVSAQLVKETTGDSAEVWKLIQEAKAACGN